jgi:hypothetical protein
MAKIIEYYVPSNFRKRVTKWIPPEQRGKVIPFGSAAPHPERNSTVLPLLTESAQEVSGAVSTGVGLLSEAHGQPGRAENPPQLATGRIVAPGQCSSRCTAAIPVVNATRPAISFIKPCS